MSDLTILTFPDGGQLHDYYGDFMRSARSCSCGWSGTGAGTTSGESFGHGVEKHCPVCDERCGFAQYSVTVAPDAPADWRSKIGPVAD